MDTDLGWRYGYVQGMDIWICRGGIYTGDGYMDMHRGEICTEDRHVDMYRERNWLICTRKPQ